MKPKFVTMATLGGARYIYRAHHRGMLMLLLTGATIDNCMSGVFICQLKK
ncbi:protein of unknown function [Thermococcus camini]|uniref:Uncharacterized protein n=1 Tax=Thermococcus camini TaxID=2016373 RepID=A0A7G2D6Q6_9EURY|nr:protein of unknown function [Thermococcus camini]